MAQLNKTYFLLTLLLFATEVFIALFVHDKFIRPYIGDVIVVVLIYCFLKSFLNLPILSTAISVLFFSYTVEFLQYFNLVEKLGLEHHKLAKIILGTSFSLDDLIAYNIGVSAILFVGKIIYQH